MTDIDSLLVDWADRLDKALPFYDDEEFAGEAQVEIVLLREVVARLAKADKLAEALREIAGGHVLDAYGRQCLHHRIAREALVAWESE